MQANLQEIYATTIRPLTKDEKLHIATLILEEVTGKASSNGNTLEPERQDDITNFFGSWRGGAVDDSNNEKIDAEIARAWTNAQPARSAKGKLSELFGAVDLGYPIDLDNERLDADLAREYENTHEE